MDRSQLAAEIQLRRLRIALSANLRLFPPTSEKARRLRVLPVDIIELAMKSIDSERLSEWYDAYSDRLMLYARTWLPEHAAQDAVQVAFTRLMSRTAPPADAPSWLFRTVRNEAITRLRRKARHRWHDRRLSRQQPGWFESRCDDLIDARTAQEILMTLEAPQREVVVLRIWGQMSLQEIAGVVGASLTTVHSRYKAALAAIRKRMERSCKTTTD
jgi:RNA polymerase sigma factor (sigma-70 family)